MKQNTLDIKILSRDLRVTCPEGEREALLSAVSYLNQKMTEISDSGKIVNIERISIMAAINIANELLTIKYGPGVDPAELKRRISAMQTTIDQELVNHWF